MAYMEKKLDIKGIINRAKKKNNKQKVSFTFDTELYSEFVRICDKQDVAMSRVLEELMKSFIDSMS